MPVRSAGACRTRWCKIRSSPESSPSLTTRRTPKRAWTDAEHQVVLELRVSGTPFHIIADKLPGRSMGAVHNQWYSFLQPRARGNTVVAGKPLTLREVTYIANAWEKLKKPHHVIARELKKSESTIHVHLARRRRESRIAKAADEKHEVSRPSSHVWTRQDNRRLKALHDKHASHDKLAQEFPSHTREVVVYRLHSLLASHKNLIAGPNRPKADYQLRQNLVDLRAQNIPWAEIGPRFPKRTLPALHGQLRCARNAGMLPSPGIGDDGATTS